jgi:serine/threonine protein kinase
VGTDIRTLEQRRMNITDPLVLRNDVVLVPVSELPPEVRAKIDFDEGDYTLSRLHGRSPSQIIDPETASLLQLFREPTTIVDAVIRNSRQLAKDPQVWLDELLPHLGVFLRNGVLVANDERESSELKPLLAPGTLVDGWETIHCVSLIEDSEIHRVRKDGMDGALKISRQPRRFEHSVFDNEAFVLEHLAGRATTPRLLAKGMHDERPFLILEWCNGADSGVATQYARHDRAKLFAICVSIAEAYAGLHDAGVIHADVHPRNVMIDGAAVRLIDFGLARVTGNAGAQRMLMPRGGMYYFFEPEYLASLYGPAQLPASFAGEQYALAAMLYLILTGKHYLEFRFDREEMMRQSREDPPLPFSARGVAPWPQVEAILGRALSKDPAARYPTMRAFVDALREVRYEVPEVSTALVGEELASLEYPIAPHASVNYGAAGAALGVLRIAEARGDARLLALAEVWQTRAARHVGDASGWYNEEETIPQSMIGPISIYHTAAGLHAVAAMIAYSRADGTAQKRALRNFMIASSQPCEQIDLTLGRFGTLLASALLFTDDLRAVGDATMQELWTKLDALPPIAQQPRETYLGVAHGWSGYLYATLRWCMAASSPFPPSMLARLEELAALRISRGRGAWWPRTLAGTLDDMMPGWCNGAAGHVFTFSAAFDATRDARWLAVARDAAWNAWEEPIHHADLCCGSAGRAYALLNYYRHTGEHEWLARARELANHAAAKAHETSSRKHALWKGELGVAVLLAELAAPEEARLPLFE